MEVERSAKNTTKMNTPPMTIWASPHQGGRGEFTISLVDLDRRDLKDMVYTVQVKALSSRQDRRFNSSKIV